MLMPQRPRLKRQNLLEVQRGLYRCRSDTVQRLRAASVPMTIFARGDGTAPSRSGCFYVETPASPPHGSSTVQPERDEGRAAASPVRSFLFPSNVCSILVRYVRASLPSIASRSLAERPRLAS
jgi:hypothetical protein